MAATVTAPGRPGPERAGSRGASALRDWFAAIPLWLKIAGFLVALIIPSLILRTIYVDGQYWMDEGLAVGISGHPLSAIPDVLRHDGSPPLYYMLLHVWMSVFGPSEVSTHWMSLVFGTLCIPLGMWAAWTLLSPRAGWYAGVLFAFNAFITLYSQETRMYALMVLLGLLATVGFVRGFVFRERRWIALFVAGQALMLYTHAWGIFFGAASVLTLALLWRLAEPDARRAMVRDGLIAYGAVALLFAPWLPIFLYQATHTAAPWDVSPRFGVPVQLSRGVLGGDRVTIALVLAALIGLVPLMIRERRRSLEAQVMWVLIAIPVATLALAWIASQITPAWVYRYFAPLVPAIVLLIALGLARAGLVGLVALVLSVVFVVNQAAYSPKYKSDMRQLAAQMGPRLHYDDIVLVGQPEETALAHFYLPGGVRFANTAGGFVSDPSYMNWVGALARISNHDYPQVVRRVLAGLRPGQQLLYIRPLTEGVVSWEAPWTLMVRRRSAQWAAIIASDRQLVPEAVAPQDYAGSCCVANSAVLYLKR